MQEKKLMDETISAIATAPGEGGIGIVRISGEKAISIANKIFRPFAAKSIGCLLQGATWQSVLLPSQLSSSSPLKASRPQHEKRLWGNHEPALCFAPEVTQVTSAHSPGPEPVMWPHLTARKLGMFPEYHCLCQSPLTLPRPQGTGQNSQSL